VLVSTYYSAGDVYGFVALFLIVVTSLLMFFRRVLGIRLQNPDFLRSVHVVIAALSGLFLILHIAYFLVLPIGFPIQLGYVSTGLIVVVWLTGAAFLERLKDSLFYHGSLSLASISLMVFHAFGSGGNIPLEFGEIAIGTCVFLLIVRTINHLSRIIPMRSGTS
jgi:hypothetical protein